MDELIFEHLVDRFRAQTSVDVRSDRMAAARLKEADDVAKIELSISTTTHITLPLLAAGPSACTSRGAENRGHLRRRWHPQCDSQGHGQPEVAVDPDHLLHQPARGEKQRMIDQAKQYAEQDKKPREEADKLNMADTVCYQGERTLADFGSKLSDDLRKRVKAAMRETRESLSKRDATLASKKKRMH